MFTINIKGKPNPRNTALVKLELIIFKRGYARVSKILQTTGPLSDWDSSTQSFKGRGGDVVAKNKNLLAVKLKYQQVAEQWDVDGKVWSPVELSHCFDQEKRQLEQQKVLTLQQMIDHQIDRFVNKQRIKNGLVVDSSNYSDSYRLLKTSLTRFCKAKYNRSLSSFHFRDITETFLLDYTMYIKQRGAENGNKGGLTIKLKQLLAMCRLAVKMGILDVALSAFDCLGDNIKWDNTKSKAVPTECIYKIEAMDRAPFSKVENLCLDLFMFSYFAGGMPNVDVCHLTVDALQDGYIVYGRMKCPKVARAILNKKCEQIIKKYEGLGYRNLIFPVLLEKHDTTTKQTRRVALYTSQVNATLRKACKILKIKERITWYSARGSFISRMVDEGESPYVVAEMAGNSPMMIYKHYYKNENGDDIRRRMNESW
ncbi:MAG: phage integrase SAM-like domain-containing protein [Rikenellaceae bacterium]